MADKRVKPDDDFQTGFSNAVVAPIRFSPFDARSRMQSLEILHLPYVPIPTVGQTDSSKLHAFTIPHKLSQPYEELRHSLELGITI